MNFYIWFGEDVVYVKGGESGTKEKKTTTKRRRRQPLLESICSEGEGTGGYDDLTEDD